MPICAVLTTALVGADQWLIVRSLVAAADPDLVVCPLEHGVYAHERRPPLGARAEVLLIAGVRVSPVRQRPQRDSELR